MSFLLSHSIELTFLLLPPLPCSFFPVHTKAAISPPPFHPHIINPCPLSFCFLSRFPRHVVSLSFNAEGCCDRSMPGPCCCSNGILWYFGGEQVQNSDNRCKALRKKTSCWSRVQQSDAAGTGKPKLVG